MSDAAPSVRRTEAARAARRAHDLRWALWLRQQERNEEKERKDAAAKR